MAGQLKIDCLHQDPELAAAVARIFGADDDPLDRLRGRARLVLPQLEVIVWEADPLTFQFTEVSDTAAELLGWPAERWYEHDFWTTHVVHPDDVADAMAYCAMATARGAPHDFEYRARRADGREIRVHDVVRVLKGPLGFAARLRGVMLPIGGQPARGGARFSRSTPEATWRSAE